MKNKIDSLHIEGFRSIRELDIEKLGTVTLITGRNNTGKSSILEAIRLLTTDSLPATIRSILQFREEDAGEEYLPRREGNTEPFHSLSNLFYNYPSFANNVGPLTISTDGNGKSLDLSIRPKWIIYKTADDGATKWIPIDEDMFVSTAAEPVPALQICNGEAKTRFILLDNLTRRVGNQSFPAMQNATFLPCVFVDPYAGRESAFYSSLWDAIALSELEKEVIQALQIIEPSITALSMIGGEGPLAPRRAIVRVSQRSRPVPMRSFGDGLNHLFGIILSLVNAKNGILLVDEFENGLHYSVQLAAWKIIFKLARELNVQVFATSHSWDSVEAFQIAAAEDPSEGMLLRLTRKGESIIPTYFQENELAVVTKEGIEVR